MRYFIDTNIFLRVATREDIKMFSECRDFLQRVKDNEVSAVSSALVLSEIVWTLTTFYKFSKTNISKIMQSIIGLKNLQFVDKYQHELALNLYKAYSVKYIDAMIASNKQIQSGKMVIVSYDKDFDKLRVVRREPKDIII